MVLSEYKYGPTRKYIRPTVIWDYIYIYFEYGGKWHNSYNVDFISIINVFDFILLRYFRHYFLIINDFVSCK